MGLFSFLFSKHKKYRTTQEAEAFREVFRENEEMFLKMEKSEELRRFQALEEEVNSVAFSQKRKEVEQLEYKGSKYYQGEKQYKALLKHKKLRSYLLVRDSQELKGYENVKTTDEYQDFLKLKVIVKSADFDKKLHTAEYNAYQAMLTRPKIAALVKFENLKRFKEYGEIKDTNLPHDYDRLAAFIQSDDFKSSRRFLLDKNRFKQTDEYTLFQEYEQLRNQSDIVKYQSLLNDPHFSEMCKWKLSFEDHFEGGKLDVRRWISRYYAGERLLNDTYGVGDDVQLYTADNISFSGSSVGLNFKKESIIGKYWDAKVGIREKKYEFTSGMISSATTFRQRYGRFEAKMKVQHSGVTGCFWMLGDAAQPHIEIMKCQVDGVKVGRVYSQAHVVKSDNQLIKEMNLGNEYYIFTLEWTPERMVWSVNDCIVKEVRDHIPDVPMYIVFSLGANQEPGDKSLPVRLDVDWVRAYRLKTDTTI